MTCSKSRSVHNFTVKVIHYKPNSSNYVVDVNKVGFRTSKKLWMLWFSVTFRIRKGNDVDLSEYNGKVLLIVNVASQCGLTNMNYTGLTELYDKYKDQGVDLIPGLEILAFPCNQFMSQEPGNNNEITQFACTRFNAEFPIFRKVDVNGANAAPIYKFLRQSKGGFFGDRIKWNFTKFLVDKEGNVIGRYSPTTSPHKIEKVLKKLLDA